MLTHTFRLAHGLAAAVALGTPCSAIFAQDADPPTDTVLPTVRVGASPTPAPGAPGKLAGQADIGALGARPLLVTPYSLTVSSAEEIADRGARSVGQIFGGDAAIYTPTASYTTDWWGTQMRGLPVRNHLVDEVPMLLHWGGDLPIEIVDSVTALKGLSGFMFGFGEPGGALSYRLKRPLSEDQTSVMMDWRHPSLISLQVDASRRPEPALGLRMVAAAERGRAYNAAEIDRRVALLSVEQRLGSQTVVSASIASESSRNTGEPLQFYFDAYDVGNSGGRLPDADIRLSNVRVDNAWYASRTLIAQTSLLWMPSAQWQLKTQLGATRKHHRSNKAFANLLNRQGDYEGYAYNFAGRLDNAFVQSMLRGELALGGLRHEVVAGLGAQQSRDTWGNEWYWENDFNGSLYTAQAFRTTRTPDFSLGPLAADTRQHYAFVSDTVHLSPRWQAIGGVRYTDFQMRDVDGDPDVASGYRARHASPTLAIIYQPDQRLSFYASMVEGLEPGTRVERPYANAGETLGATVSRQIEVGMKRQSEVLEAAVALFRVERANQVDRLVGGARYLTQDGRVTYQGLEMSGQWRATRAWSLGLSVVRLDAGIDRVSDDAAALIGNAPAFAPKWQAAAQTSYQPASLPGWRLHGLLRYDGRAWTSDDNVLQVPGRSVVSVGLSRDFRWADLDLTVRANINNVFDRRYWAGGGWSAATLGETRNGSLSLEARL